MKKKFKFFFDQNCNFLSLGLHKLCPSYRRSLQISKEAIQHAKHELLPLLWVIFALLDPDPDLDSESGFGFTGPIEYGSNPDPDTKLCLQVRYRTKAGTISVPQVPSSTGSLLCPMKNRTKILHNFVSFVFSKSSYLYLSNIADRIRFHNIIRWRECRGRELCGLV
jgi:hypothetical protein